MYCHVPYSGSKIGFVNLPNNTELLWMSFLSPLAFHVLVGDGEADEALDDLPGVEPDRQRRAALVRDAEAPDRHGLVWVGL